MPLQYSFERGFSLRQSVLIRFIALSKKETLELAKASKFYATFSKLVGCTLIPIFLLG